MSVKLLTEHHLEFLSVRGGCTGSSESIYVKIPHCWKSCHRSYSYKINHFYVPSAEAEGYEFWCNIDIKDGKERHVCEHGKDKDSGVGTNLALLKKAGKDLFAVHLTGTGRNTIFCGGKLLWMHKKCSDIKGVLDPDL